MYSDSFTSMKKNTLEKLKLAVSYQLPLRIMAADAGSTVQWHSRGHQGSEV